MAAAKKKFQYNYQADKDASKVKVQATFTLFGEPAIIKGFLDDMRYQGGDYNVSVLALTASEV